MCSSDLERLVGVALLREAGLRPFAALPQHRVDVAAEQGGDVDLHLLPPYQVDVGGADSWTLDGKVRALRQSMKRF